MGAVVDRAHPRCRCRSRRSRHDHRPPLDLEVETAWVHYPRRQIEIIDEIGTWPILPILQTMAGGLNPEADKQRRSFRCVNVYKARRAGAGISISRVRSHLAQT